MKLAVLCVLALFAWLVFTRLGRRTPRASAPTVTVDATGVRRTLSGGREESVRWEDLVEIGVLTTDEGPYVEDVYWMLVGADGRGCAVPNAEVKPLLDRMGRLRGVAWDAVIRAQGCCDNASFVVWQGARGDARVLAED